MAFSFFKKKNHADAIFANCVPVTDDEELASCSWVAVKDGRVSVIGEGDSWSDLKGKETAFHDLGGRFLSPGLIDAFADPAAEVLGDIGLKADPSWEREELMRAVEEYLASKEDPAYCFVTGAGMKLFDVKKPAAEEKAEEPEAPKTEDAGTANDGGSEEAPNDGGPAEASAEGFTARLDRASGGVPTVIMFEDGISLRLNSAAASMVTERADQLNVTTISPELALDTVISIDYSTKAAPLMNKAMELAQKGCTAVCGAPEVSTVAKLYKDLLIDSVSCGMLKQRYLGCTVYKRMIVPGAALYAISRARTECTELDGKILYDTICLKMSSAKGQFSYFSADYLNKLLEDTADRGFSVRIYALDKEAALTAIDVLGELSASYKKQSFTVLCSEMPKEEELSELFTGNVAVYPIGGPENPGGDEGWQLMTASAAKDCAVSSLMGSLEEGKLADFAVFDKDPRTLAAGEEPKAYMTVLSGVPVYTEGEDSAEAWTEVMKEQLDSFAADFAGFMPENEKEFEETAEFDEIAEFGEDPEFGEDSEAEDNPEN